MSRDVSWGLYIGQFTFLVGVAASAVMLVLPYYLHNYKVFGKITLLGRVPGGPHPWSCVSHSSPWTLGRPRTSHERDLARLLQLDPFLGYRSIERILDAEHSHRLDCLSAERNRRTAPQMGETSDLPLHPLGGQHSHGYGLSVRRPSWKRFLAHSRLWLPDSSGQRLQRSCAVDTDLHVPEEYTKFDAGWEAIQRCPRL